jgi:Tat protein translocase TatC
VAPDEIVPVKEPVDPELADPIDETVPAEGLRMPIIEHLRELRVRLIRVAIALTVGFIVAYFFSDQLFAALTMPIRQVAQGKLLLIGTGVGEAFFTKIKVSLVAGLFLASPAVFWEIWKFIAPGLYQSERKMAFPFIVFATIFFISGGYFCWAVVFKVGYRFFLDQYSSIGVTPTIRISEYLAFRNADFRVLPDPARPHRLQDDAEAVPLCDPDHLRDLGSADSARYGFAIPARDSAAVPVRHQRWGFVPVPQQSRTCNGSGKSDSVII